MKNGLLKRAGEKIILLFIVLVEAILLLIFAPIVAGIILVIIFAVIVFAIVFLVLKWLLYIFFAIIAVIFS